MTKPTAIYPALPAGRQQPFTGDTINADFAFIITKNGSNLKINHYGLEIHSFYNKAKK
jgi:hypothetical protein